MAINTVIKPIKKKIKRIANKERMFKLLIVVSSLALLATTVLPYILQ